MPCFGDFLLCKGWGDCRLVGRYDFNHFDVHPPVSAGFVEGLKETQDSGEEVDPL